MDMLKLTNNQPAIEKIIKASATISITSSHLISNPIGHKIVVTAVKHIEIEYITQDTCSKVCHVNFTVPFCMYIPIDNLKTNNKKFDVSTKRIYAHKVDDKTIAVSMIISAQPIFQDNKAENINSICAKEPKSPTLFIVILTGLVVLLILNGLTTSINKGVCHKKKQCQHRHHHS